MLSIIKIGIIIKNIKEKTNQAVLKLFMFTVSKMNCQNLIFKGKEKYAVTIYIKVVDLTDNKE